MKLATLKPKDFRLRGGCWMGLFCCVASACAPHVHRCWGYDDSRLAAWEAPLGILITDQLQANGDDDEADRQDWKAIVTPQPSMYRLMMMWEPHRLLRGAVTLFDGRGRLLWTRPVEGDACAVVVVWWMAKEGVYFLKFSEESALDHFVVVYTFAVERLDTEAV